MDGWSARFAFDITAPGATATLFNASGEQVRSIRFPTQNETGFDPGLYLINAAKLNLTISSSDFARETVITRSGFNDGNTLLLQQTYSLGTGLTESAGQRRYLDITIDLITSGLGQYMQDGRFVTFVIAPDTRSRLPSNCRIDKASIMVDVTPVPPPNVTPVPLPAAFWLFGSGLIGLVGIRKRGTLQ